MTRVVFPRKLSQSTEAAPGPASTPCTPSTQTGLSLPKRIGPSISERGPESASTRGQTEECGLGQKIWGPRGNAR
jgi:hypothetical protein